ncbi:ATP-dependent RNA helicase HrpA [Thermopirellula anaerolimosa]
MNASIEEIRGILPDVMLADRFPLRRALERLARDGRTKRGGEAALKRLRERAEASAARRAERAAKVPWFEFSGGLPILDALDDIAAAVESHPAVIVCGETGSGKSTQLPKLCLKLGRGIAGMIGHTQPRRIAARSVAARIAEELGVPLGKEVGFKVRFTDLTGADTYIKLMTDGILLAETQTDRFLEQYDTLIIDEAHERSLNIDFLLGYLRRLLDKRSDLKVIVTSATIDAERFAAHFAVDGTPAPVIEVSGRMYPVEVRYRPPVVDDPAFEPNWQDEVAGAVVEALAATWGDILVFLPTERHIHEAARLLRARGVSGEDRLREAEVIPLYARLSVNEQQRIFQPHGRRRIILATNVAESSLTVPGIRCVVDSGVARISRYSPRTKTQRLPIEPISRASAEQRKGRCGREGPGVCIRLYEESDLERRDRYTPPEILRTNLANVILQLKALRLGDPETFPFLDPPRSDAVRDGFKTLWELQALDEDGELTPLGRELARMPVDPRIGRIILAAREEGSLHEVLIIAAGLEVDDPRLRPQDRAADADAAHARFHDPQSDFLTYLNLWEFYQNLKAKLSRNQLQKACAQNYLSYNRLREWADVYRELQALVREAGMASRRGTRDYAAIHRAILTGFLTNTGYRKQGHEYQTAGGGKAHLWPGSALFESKPHWVVAAEIVETGRRYLRTCARIDPAWIEDLAPHLIKRDYVDPYWSRRYGAAMIHEKVTLQGLPVVPRRRMALGPIDAAAAREMLIQHGLVEGEIECKAAFFEHNRRLVKRMEELQVRLRRVDLLLGSWAQFDFYDQRIPHDVYDLRGLLAWWREACKKDRSILHMSSHDVVREDSGASPEAFPDHLAVGTTPVPLRYRFAPGEDDDGITLTVPVELFPSLDPERLAWFVPGLLREKVTALIKSLPKELRRKLIPAQESAERAVRELTFGEGRFLPAVAAVLSKLAGEDIRAQDFRLDKLPAEMQFRVCVVDGQGKPLAVGRDWESLRRSLGAEVGRSFTAVDDPQWHRDGIRRWEWPVLPEVVEVMRGGIRLQAFPALIDAGDGVSLRLADSAARAAVLSRFGIRRLLAFAMASRLDPHWDQFADRRRLELLSVPLPEFDFGEELKLLLADRAFLDETLIGPWEIGQWGGLPRTREQFDDLMRRGLKRLPPAVQEVLAIIRPLLERYHEARLALESADSPQWEEARADMAEQLAELTRPGFLTQTPWGRLRAYPRYFKAVCRRIEALRLGGVFRDRQALAAFRPYWEAYCERRKRHEELDVFDPELTRFRWMLEEYRVSLFAQSLGTDFSVSPPRLDRQWAKVRQ